MDQTTGTFDVKSHLALLRQFLAEDMGAGDVTTAATVSPGLMAKGRFVVKSPMVLAGLDIAFEVFRLLDSNLSTEAVRCDGDCLKSGDEPAAVCGSAQALLSGERVALNLLQRLCGIATLTRKFTDAVAGTGVKILDTRKTTPGLRAFEKYAVTAGGGHNHRFGLGDAILIKENHIRLAGGIRSAMVAARSTQAGARFLEVEVTTLREMEETLRERPDAVLLDNMSPEETARAAKLGRSQYPKIILEASGGITLASLRQYAAAGVDWISVGALTHSAPAADVSFEIEPLDE